MKKILMIDNCDDQSTIGDDDASLSEMNDDDNGNGERAGSSKSNSVTSDVSVGVSASSQGSSTNSLPVPPMGVPSGISGMEGQSDTSILQPSPYPPNAFHRQLSQQQSQQQAQQLLRNSAKLSNPNSRGRIAAAAAGLAVATDDGTIGEFYLFLNYNCCDIRELENII